jgi:hypothetical protein
LTLPRPAPSGCFIPALSLGAGLFDQRFQRHMAKIILGKRPEAFTSTVAIPMLDGSVGEVKFEFHTRSRTEHAKIMDEHRELVLAKTKGQSGDKFSMAGFLGIHVDADADLILQLAKGWDLDDPFTKENVVRFINDFGGAGQRTVDACALAINEGIVKN